MTYLTALSGSTVDDCFKEKYCNKCTATLEFVSQRELLRDIENLELPRQQCWARS